MPKRLHVDRSSVRKVCQLTGQWDRELDQPAFNRTEDRFGLFGTDLGISFEHGGKLWFLFGDTWPGPAPTDDHDSVAWSTSAFPEPGVDLTFVSQAGPSGQSVYRPPRLIGQNGIPLSTGGFEVPIAGFSSNGKMYVFHTTGSIDDNSIRSVLALARNGDPTDLHVKYEVSALSQSGRFINIACAVAEDARVHSVPVAGPVLLVWGSGNYRKSEVYFGWVPLAGVEQRESWRFFAGVSSTGTPQWSDDETRAAPMFNHPEVGELSVAFVAPLQHWLMLYNAGSPRGINSRIAKVPWGPWSDPPVVIFDPNWPGVGYVQFMHMADRDDGLSDPGRRAEWGGEYGPYLIERFTRPVDPGEGGPKAQVYFALSTWNPYNTVLMTATLEITERKVLPMSNVSGTTNDAAVAGVFGENTGQGGVGVAGVSVSGDGVRAVSKFSNGVSAFSDAAVGVFAKAKIEPGVVGTSNSNDGVRALSKSGNGVSAFSTSGTGIFAKGPANAGFFEGNVTVTGQVHSNGADVAELFDVASHEGDVPGAVPGSVVVLDDQGGLAPCTQAYDPCVAGVVSGAGDRVPGIVLDRQEHSKAGQGDRRRAIAVVGKVWCQADASLRPIRVGDLLTTSPTVGHAMPALDREAAFGAVLGKALTPLASGTGLVLVLVGLG
ncbi:DUF4185 domain-containing protein [Streptomyces kutzneri]|uniref:DUF4185 domain-containing protein n=1 Tax=Streptomyces kutzneri TaxID=3051179 RepID=UPI0028D0EB56|nr:DUF4185 domain-containing protein [Streptomyces sp. DSM 40907]